MVSPLKKRHKPKPRPKPIISYPPVPTKKWIPPDERPKTPRVPTYKPEKVHQKLPVSSLKKVWHNFDVYGDRALLTGTISQTHKRFPFKSNGHQSPCNCVAAIAYSRLFDMSLWTKQMLDRILELGDRLYLESSRYITDKTRKEIKLSEVYHTFYVDHIKVSMDFKGKKLMGKLVDDYNETPYLKQVLQNFFASNQSGVLMIQKRYFSLWNENGAFYIFDPTEHNAQGFRWIGTPGTGYCLLFRLISINHVVNFFRENFDSIVNPKFILTPCTMLRKLLVNTRYPQCLESAKFEVRPIPSKVLAKPSKPKIDVTKIPTKETGKTVKDIELKEDEVVIKDDARKRLSGDPFEGKIEVPSEGKTKKTSKLMYGFKEPIEKPRTQSITYFQELLPEKVGILRSRTHQCDPNFTKYLGKQSLANATAAITMLRKFKSKHWTSFVLDEILKLGEIIYHDSMKSLTGDQTLKVTTICRKIVLYEDIYEPEVEEFSAVGKLNSKRSDILDLLPALKIFFSDNDACILCGPVDLAVWVEDQYYYMFDPNERDKNGLAIVREVKIGSFQRVFDIEPGFACVTWFKNLKDLVDLYINNVPKENRRDRFTLSKIQIKDYIQLPDSWNNFQALTQNKWILRGNFSQNNARYSRDTRNTQCTANAAMSIIMATLVPVKAWSSETMDQILDNGDKYYSVCCDVLRENGAFVSRLLMADELLKKYQIDDNKEVNLEIDDCIINGNLTAPNEDKDFPNLNVGLQQFFADSDYCILTCRSMSMAAWKTDETFYYFDSHTRDENGIACGYGTSCIIRTTAIGDLTNSILANLGGGAEALYNISRVAVKIYDASDGIAKPPLNAYTAINLDTSILRADISEISPQFKINRGKQTVPNNLIALGMTQICPSAEWTRDFLGEVLTLGNKLYMQSMEFAMQKELGIDPKPKRQTKTKSDEKLTRFEEEQKDDETKKEEDVIDDDEDNITSAKVLKQFKFGVNHFQIELGQAQTGPLFELKDTLTKIYDSSEDTNKKAMLLESSLLTVALWKEDGLFYIFDPKPRDDLGQIFGKDEWSTRQPSLDTSLVEQSQEDEGGDIPEKTDKEDRISGISKGTIDTENVIDDENLPKDDSSLPDENIDEEAVKSIEKDVEKEMELYGDQGEEENREKKAAIIKHSSHYWRELEKNGKACVMWFTKSNYMIDHVINNIPPSKGDVPFKLIPVNIINRAAIKNTYDPETGAPPVDKIAGNWYEFKEIDYGKWILRGGINQTNKIFPATNRGKQCTANCFTALAFAKLYALNKFKPRTVDHILMYGDRLFTFNRNARKSELKDNKDLQLSDEEIEMILVNENYGPREMTPNFCLGNDKVKIVQIYDYVMGDINSKNPDEIPDVLRGLELFFVHNKFGILIAKDLLVAIWRTGNIFYMFDQNSRGPNGLKCANGVACITRYKELEDMVDIFLNNLSKEGSNNFYVHLVNVEADSCPREEVRKPKPTAIQEQSPAGFIPIVPGKMVVRGNISQEHSMFSRGSNVQFAPIALVALAMTLIHKCMYWTKPIIDEIIIIGDRLYGERLETLGFEFNPWEEKMTLDMAPTDFKIGALRASCELRSQEETGIMCIRDSYILNLRQGIENFFKENSHGVIETDHLVLAIWEETEPKWRVFMFDPNSRGPTGMPTTGGTACVLMFDNAKMAADHFISLIPDFAGGEFRITPVDVCVGKVKSRTKKKKENTEITSIPTNVFTSAPKTTVPTKAITPSEKRKQRELELQARKQMEAQRVSKLGRKDFYKIPICENNIWVMRGSKSLFNKQYSTHSRGFQDIPVCLTSYVMERLLPFAKWTWKVIDMVIDIGDQLYKNSYIMYKPSNKKLGLDCVIRDIIIKNMEVKIAIGKPVLINHFSAPYLEKALEMFFRMKNYCMISVNENYIAVFFKDEYYYVFDPHGVDIHLNRVCNGADASLIKFDKLATLCEKVINNYKLDKEVVDVFSIIMVSIKSVKMLTLPVK